MRTRMYGGVRGRKTKAGRKLSFSSYSILECTAVVQEGNIRKTMAARGLVNGRGPRSGRDLVFRCYPPELLPPKKKTEADLLGQPLDYCNIQILSCLRSTLNGPVPELLPYDVVDAGYN